MRAIQIAVKDSSLPKVEEALATTTLDIRGLDDNGQSLLFFAVQRRPEAAEAVGDPAVSSAAKVCKRLIEDYGVDATQEDHRGQTALHYLASTSNVDCVDILMRHRCEVDHVDRFQQQTPLFYAAHKGSSAMLCRLLELRADARLKDKQGKMPIFWAARLDACKQLATESAVSFADMGKTAVTYSVEWRKQHERSDSKILVEFLRNCIEAWSFKNRMSWLVRDDDASTFASYVTAHARHRDVDQLCSLEEEFIQDHRKMLPTLSDRELFVQIGLNPGAATRRSTIQHIAKGLPQNGPVRHYTLACHRSTDIPKGSTGNARAKSCRVVGYIYFKVCDGVRDDDPIEEHGSGPASSAQVKGQKSTRQTRQEAAQVGYIVISHIKVSHDHQQRGIARVLLAGALRVAASEGKGIICRTICLSVVERNLAACCLYQKLGFVRIPGNRYEGWVSMRRPIVEPSLSGLAGLWLRSAWAATGVSGGDRRGVDLEDSLREAKRQRRLSSNLSDVSTSDGSAVSVSTATSTAV